MTAADDKDEANPQPGSSPIGEELKGSSNSAPEKVKTLTQPRKSQADEILNAVLTSQNDIKYFLITKFIRVLIRR
jgi:hypothetical protein